MSRDFKINEMIEKITEKELETIKKINEASSYQIDKILSEWEKEREVIIAKYAMMMTSENDDISKIKKELTQMAFPCKTS